MVCFGLVLISHFLAIVFNTEVKEEKHSSITHGRRLKGNTLMCNCDVCGILVKMCVRFYLYILNTPV